jgi:hypothetical protein
MRGLRWALFRRRQRQYRRRLPDLSRVDRVAVGLHGHVRQGDEVVVFAIDDGT